MNTSHTILKDIQVAEPKLLSRFLYTGVKVLSISSLTLLWICALETRLLHVSLHWGVWLDHSCSIQGLSGAHQSSWPCFPLHSCWVHSIILVSLFFNLHSRPLGPAGLHNLRNSPWKIGSVDHTRSFQAAQCSCIHERWKIYFPVSGLHPLLSPLFMRYSVCVTLETLITKCK